MGSGAFSHPPSEARPCAASCLDRIKRVHGVSEHLGADRAVRAHLFEDIGHAFDIEGNFAGQLSEAQQIFRKVLAAHGDVSICQLHFADAVGRDGREQYRIGREAGEAIDPFVLRNRRLSGHRTAAFCGFRRHRRYLRWGGFQQCWAEADSAMVEVEAADIVLMPTASRQISVCSDSASASSAAIPR